MYVLMDMEWVSNRQNQHWPTQLAAARVDEHWNTVDTFSALICPKDSTFARWEHMGFAGHAAAEFMGAPVLAGVLHRLTDWLRPEDIPCWWHRQAAGLLRRFLKAEQMTNFPDKTVYLNSYVSSFLSAEGSPYHLCAVRGIVSPSPAHCAENDVRTLQLLLQGIRFPQEALRFAPIKHGTHTAYKGTKEYPLLYDPKTALLHRSDCELLTEGRPFPAFPSYRQPLIRRYHPCACCRSALRHALIERNRDSIKRSEYVYLFAERSKVFHTRNCPYMLAAHEVRGCVRYESCIAHGQRPCRHCNPQPAERMPKLRAPKPVRKYILSREEQDALDRFERAKKQRTDALRDGKLDQNIMALSQPGLAFWAGRGYRTFHRRGCPKLTGLRELRGFVRFKDAVRAGYTPCRHCRPSAKQDVVYSIPISSCERGGENVQTLVELCTAHGLPFTYDARYFVFQTAVGRWRIDMERRPVHLEHINLITSPENTQQYHVQPRLFLSLRDTFDYIIRHDGQLTDKAEEYSEDASRTP